MCGPHEDRDIIFGPVRYIGWQSFSASLYHKLSVALIFLLMSLSQALSQHPVTRTKNFLSRARLAPTRITLWVPTPALQMQVLATRVG